MLRHSGVTWSNSVSQVPSTPCTTFQPQGELLSQAGIPWALLHIHGVALFSITRGDRWSALLGNTFSKLNSAPRSLPSLPMSSCWDGLHAPSLPLERINPLRSFSPHESEQTHSRGARVVRNEVSESHLRAVINFSDTFQSSGGDPSASALC